MGRRTHTKKEEGRDGPREPLLSPVFNRLIQTETVKKAKPVGKKGHTDGATGGTERQAQKKQQLEWMKIYNNFFSQS